MKQFLLFVFVTCCLALSSCEKIKGDGPVVTEYRNVGNFSSIRTSIDGDVHYSKGNAYSVEIRAQQNIIDILETRTSGGELQIGYNGQYNIGRHERIDIYVTCPTVDMLTASGSGNIYIPGTLTEQDVLMRVEGSGSINIDALETNHADARISGSGDVHINSGNAWSARYQIDGSGSVDALNLTARDVTAGINGSGSIRLTATDYLNATIAGSGDIVYKGSPRIDTRISGSGRVRRW